MQLADRVLQFHNVGVASFNVRQRLPGLLRLHNDLETTTFVIVLFEKKIDTANNVRRRATKKEKVKFLTP